MEKIEVTNKEISVHAYGDGGHVSASFTTKTEEDARKLEKALDELTEKIDQ